MPAGVKMMLNSGQCLPRAMWHGRELIRHPAGEFYGHEAATTNLQLLSRFFQKYPEYAEKTFLSVKGGTQANSLVPDGS